MMAESLQRLALPVDGRGASDLGARAYNKRPTEAIINITIWNQQIVTISHNSEAAMVPLIPQNTPKKIAVAYYWPWTSFISELRFVRYLTLVFIFWRGIGLGEVDPSRRHK